MIFQGSLSRHRHAKSDSWLLSSVSLQEEEPSIAPRSLFGHPVHMGITTEDVSSLLSRMAHLEAELREALATTTIHRHPERLISLPDACPPCKQQMPHSLLSLNDPVSFCSCKEKLSEPVKLLLSLPFIKAMVGTVANSIATGAVYNLEEALVSEIRSLSRDPLSVWSEILPPAPSVSGPRSPEHYLAALDIAVKARKETKDCRKVAKFWKCCFLRAYAHSCVTDIPLTPSPSDISDTGLSELLSPLRKEKLDELMARRRRSLSKTADISFQWLENPFFTPNGRPTLMLVPDESDSIGSPSPSSALDTESSSLSPDTSASVADEGEDTLVEHGNTTTLNASAQKVSSFIIRSNVICNTLPSPASPPPTRRKQNMMVPHSPPITSKLPVLSTPTFIKRSSEMVNGSYYNETSQSPMDHETSDGLPASEQTKHKLHELHVRTSISACHTPSSHPTNSLCRNALLVARNKSGASTPPMMPVPHTCTSRDIHRTGKTSAWNSNRDIASAGGARSIPRLKSLILPEAHRNTISPRTY